MKDLEWHAEDKLPAGWNSAPLKALFEIQLGKMLQSDSESEHDLLVPYLKSAHVQWKGVQVQDLPEMWVNQRELRKYAVGPGDLLVCEGGDVGRAALLEGFPANCIIQNALHRVRPRRDSSTRFLKYVLEHLVHAGWFNVLCNKATIAHLTSEKLGSISIPVPTSPNQHAIAAFLDRQCSAITTAVDCRRQQRALLEESRQLRLSRVVTQGLRPSSTCRDSGIPWIGMIPSHWRTVRLRDVARRVVVGIAEAATHAYVESEGIKIVRSVDLQPNHLRQSDLLQVAPWFAKKNRSKTIYAGDLLSQRTGEFSGATAVVPPELHGAQCFTMLITTPSPELDAQYASYCLNSTLGLEYFNQTRWGTAQPNISVPILQDVPLPLPPIGEQEAIVRLLRESERDHIAAATSLEPEPSPHSDEAEDFTDRSMLTEELIEFRH